jgi:hypothetical protein
MPEHRPLPASFEGSAPMVAARHWTKPHFVGDVETRWLHERGDDRRMQLLKPFAFQDRHGVLWEAPNGWIVDGASIPRFFWRLCDPFVGDYRLASVVHDVACDQKTRPWQQVHRMFYEAMVCAGVPKWKARLMGAAVFVFGPHWKTPHCSVCGPGVACTRKE